jgi:crossover junction endodeoxyribonuclease RuvC
MEDNQKFIVGMDPGLSGAIAFLRPDGLLHVLDMPTRKQNGKNILCLERLAQRFDRHDILTVMLEQQGVRPKQAAQSGFKTGEGFGILKGILAAHYHKFEIVTPAKWKKFMGVTKDKNQTRAVASELMPRAAHKWNLAKHDGRAEAALLALYAAEINTINIKEIYTC